MDKKILGPKIKILNTLIEKNLNNRISRLIPNVTGSQFAVLVSIYLRNKEDENIYQKQLEQTLRLSHPTIRGILKRLNSLGYVQLEKDDVDQRQVVVSLSVSGMKFMDKNYAPVTENIYRLESEMLVGIDTTEQQLLSSLLDKLINNLE